MFSSFRCASGCYTPARQAGGGIMFSTCSVRLVNAILNDPIVMPVATSGPRGKGIE